MTKEYKRLILKCGSTVSMVYASPNFIFKIVATKIFFSLFMMRNNLIAYEPKRSRVKSWLTFFMFSFKLFQSTLSCLNVIRYWMCIVFFCFSQLYFHAKLKNDIFMQATIWYFQEIIITGSLKFRVCYLLYLLSQIFKKLIKTCVWVEADTHTFTCVSVRVYLHASVLS